MKSHIERLTEPVDPQALLGVIGDKPGTIWLDSSSTHHPNAQFSLVVTQPIITLSTRGSACRVRDSATGKKRTLFGNPWAIMEAMMQPFECLEELDSPFPLGGCFGFWGYGLKHFVEPRLERRAVYGGPCPDAYLGFYPSLLVIDHQHGTTWIVATGFRSDGSTSRETVTTQVDGWKRILEAAQQAPVKSPASPKSIVSVPWQSHPDRDAYLRSVQMAKRYIQQGDIYQLNLARALKLNDPAPALDLYKQIQHVSPAPFSGFLQAGSYQILSSSPECFLKVDGSRIQTRPIKGTRPRGADPQSDATLAYQLQSSEKERAELLMITDLLRNDLGKVCRYGSVMTPEIMKLERHPQVHHLVSTVEGVLRADCTHLHALRECFPGGSITGAPKFRAMELIEQLEPQARGPYTGCMGYLGFNKMSQWNILIRTAIRTHRELTLHVGSGIVADSDPESEFQETQDKAAGWLRALEGLPQSTRPIHPTTQAAAKYLNP